MSNYIVEISSYIFNTTLSPFPLPEALINIGGTYLFSYQSGVGLRRIDDPDGIRRREHLHHRCAGVLISQYPSPPDLQEKVIFICPAHPKESCCPRKSDGYEDWRPLAFEENGTSCSLDHLGTSSTLISNPRASWAPLFDRTAHASRSTDETREHTAVLKGVPEILWALVALNVNDIGNLGAHISFVGDHRMSLALDPGSQPDTTPSRALAVKIYHNKSKESPTRSIEPTILLH